MSTFDGHIAEFPDIRIDYFRPARSDTNPALAYFLSHVHSDHLAGLETCKSPFIYCSPATRDILLRLEKYPHRMNFAKGILEQRKKTYRHLTSLLKAIPLETPTVIELQPGKEIRVTLFDANHCVGAVMFLVEKPGTAILYTGDIRSESWWVNALTRHPVLLPYVCSSDIESSVKLDTIYLDTTFVVTGREDPYAQFPSKADGLRELMQKVTQYPSDTVFYLDAWTFGYEDVWQALSTILGSRIHVDDYRYGLYRALANGIAPKAGEASTLIGFYCGNHFQQGCLSGRSDECRIHSCEKGTGCDIWEKDFVRITPIVSRHNGTEIVELGAGGGQGDLNQQHELEVFDAELVGQLMALCASKLHGQPQLLSSVLQMLTSIMKDRVPSIKLEGFNLATGAANSASEETSLDGLDDLQLEKLVPALAKIVTMEKQKQKQSKSNLSLKSKSSVEDEIKGDNGLPKRITFPYSRHSSYNELCQLVEAFKPKNIHPCTVDEANWAPSSSMNFLFGHIYTSSPSFRHDEIMLKKRSERAERQESCSRPVSSQSSISAYATPNAYPSIISVNQALKPVTSISQALRDNLDAGDEQAQVNDISSRKRSKHDRQPQGDFWPPLDVDHYSPSHERKRRRSSTAAAQVQDREEIATDWPALSSTDTVSVDRLQNRWRKRIAEATPSERQLNESGSARATSRSRQSVHYGRLSPPPVSKIDETEDINVHYQFDKSNRRQKSHEMKVSSRARNYASSEFYTLSSPAQGRLAFRQEVSDAVLGRNGADWSDIGLVSVNGHQVEEEEL